MIVHTDLRPGNYVKSFDKGKKKLLKLTLDDLVKIRDESLEVFPVKIVGQWLTRFGFSFLTSFTHYKLPPGYFSEEKEGWFYIKKDAKVNQYPFLYIHQLQNFFYALTGEELVIK
jgi:hypothetical protein